MLTLLISGLEKEKVKSEYIRGNSVIYRDKTLATIELDPGNVVFRIHPQLEMAEYEALRELILQITADVDVEIDEKECNLGYLENGEPAHLIKNWELWKTFLMKAKLRTLEGQKVILKNESGDELAFGLLAEYEMTTDPFKITSCTIITIYGERKFAGTSLFIEPTNQFR